MCKHREQNLTCWLWSHILMLIQILMTWQWMNDRSHSSCIWLLATSSFSLVIGFISLQLPDQMAFVPSYNLCTQIHISHLHSACGCGSNCVWNHWLQWQIARIDLNGSRIGAHSAVVSSHVTSILIDQLDIELHALKCQVLEASWEAVCLATHVSVGTLCICAVSWFCPWFFVAVVAIYRIRMV